MTINGRKVKDNLTAEQLAKLAEYGSIDFKSAGAVRKPVIGQPASCHGTPIAIRIAGPMATPQARMKLDQ
jgi:hypothetical protein